MKLEGAVRGRFKVANIVLCVKDLWLGIPFGFVWEKVVNIGLGVSRCETCIVPSLICDKGDLEVLWV